MTPEDAKEPKWSRRPDDRPEELLTAALTEFSEKGFARARLEDVARRAGVSKGTVYLYFESKEALFREAVRARLTEVFAGQDELIEKHQGTTRELLELFIRRMWAVVRSAEICGIARLVQSELDQFPDLARFWMDEVVTRTRAQLKVVLDRGAESGEFRSSDNPFLTRAIPALVVNTAQFQRTFGNIDPTGMSDADVLDGVIDFILHGTLSRRDQPGRTE